MRKLTFAAAFSLAAAVGGALPAAAQADPPTDACAHGTTTAHQNIPHSDARGTHVAHDRVPYC